MNHQLQVLLTQQDHIEFKAKLKQFLSLVKSKHVNYL